MNELETRWRDLGEFIRDQRRIGHLSLRKLSEMAGISNPYLSQIERGLRKPSAEILQQIARALEISSETLYIRAGILEEREGDTDLITEIRRDLWLSEEQKKTLVQIYESFRAERRAAGFEPELVGQGRLDDEIGDLATADDLDADGADADSESEALAGR
ncbi:MAG: helix-turn-helix transcriptional regulator [Acidimicrobiales bacterium]|nr:helix-turn-helix transcriptional regulator [Acidimicrobiales bacterium]